MVRDSFSIDGRTRTSSVKQKPASSGAATAPAESIERRNPGSSGDQTWWA
jgi:hypothetical protein